MLWQDLVDIHKVYAALSKLKEINPLYASINLPPSASQLELDKRISACVVTDPPDPIANDKECNDHVEDHDSDLLPDREPMVRRISEGEEAELYHDYTLFMHFMHPGRMKRQQHSINCCELMSLH